MKNRVTTVLSIVFAITICKAQINPWKLNTKPPPPLIEIQEAIEYNLNHIKIDGSDSYTIYRYPFSKQRFFYNYISEKAKKRMIELLEGKWTEEEIELRINGSIKSTLDTLSPYNGYYKNAKKIAKRDSLPLQRVWDSMLTARKNEYRKSTIENNYVDRIVIRIAGYLRDPRFLPYLKKSDINCSRLELELALARYGEEPYYSNAIKKYTYDEWFRHYDIWNLVYICSHDAIEQIYNYIMNEDDESCDSNGECYGYSMEIGISALKWFFESKAYSDEISAVEHEYMKDDIKPDKAYLKKMRAITKKYYTQFKEQKPNCEKGPVDAW